MAFTFYDVNTFASYVVDTDTTQMIACLYLEYKSISVWLPLNALIHILQHFDFLYIVLVLIPQSEFIFHFLIFTVNHLL